MIEEIPAALAGERLDRVVALLTGCSRTVAAELVGGGRVLVGGIAVTSGKHRLEAGDVVEVDHDPAEVHRPEGDPGVAITVVHEDADIVVVDKAAGLVVHPGAGNPTGTLVHGLLARYPNLAAVGDPARPGIVHRLDKDTSGLMVVARSPEAYTVLVAALAAREVTREYSALCWGLPEADAGLVDAPLGRATRSPTKVVVKPDGKVARTRYSVEQRWAASEVSALRCTLETGRTHQIRVHLAAIGHPVLGDSAYGRRARPPVEVPRVALHARRLAFDHPVSGASLEFVSPLPADLAAVRAALDAREAGRA